MEDATREPQAAIDAETKTAAPVSKADERAADALIRRAKGNSRAEELLAEVEPNTPLEALKRQIAAINGQFDAAANALAAASSASDPAVQAMMADFERAVGDIAGNPADEGARTALIAAIANIRVRADVEVQQQQRPQQPDAQVTPAGKQPVGEHTEEEHRRRQQGSDIALGA